jgi:protein SCO1/2
MGAVLMGVLLVGFQLSRQPYVYKGSSIDPPVPAANFELTNQVGDKFELSDQRGKLVLMFFGYTHCPDVCPLTLSNMKYIREQLGEKADEVSFVFVTVDPERDTQERLREFLQVFDASFIGLTGTRAELEPVWKSYGVYQAKQEVGSSAGYLVDHTARTYVIDQDGNWRLTYPFEMTKEDILADVRHLLGEG